MDIRVRLLAKKIPMVHSSATAILDRANQLYYARRDRKLGYREQIRQLRGAYAGKRCFVVGNGPSLSVNDLDMITGEYSMGANLIFKFFDDTKWRPTFYFAQDVYDQRLREYVEQQTKGKTFIGAYFLRKHKIQNPNPIAFLGNKRRGEIFSSDCSKQVGEMATITYTMLQFAVYMGFSEIYLLGIDNTYRNTVDAQSRVTTDESIQDHFYASDGSHVSYANTGQMTSAYEIAKRATASRDVEILNATRGGALEVFRRTTLEEILWPSR